MNALKKFAFALAALGTLAPAGAMAETINVAVAANFTAASKDIAAAFRKKTGDEAKLSFGSTGSLYTQITQGAPFQVFLAADRERPKKAVDEGYGVEGTAFTYAVGKLVLWSRQAGLVKDGDTLKAGRFDKVSICNPTAAPYGAAAVEAMKSLKVYGDIEPKLVQGANVSQAFQFVQTGNAEIGFVALSQVIDDKEGSTWVVPQDLYTPIRQDAVLLKTGADSKAAKAFVDFLKSPEAGAIIEKYGYATGGE